MTDAQLTVEHGECDWEIHDGHGDLVGVFATRLGALQFAECFTPDVIVIEI